MREIDMVEGEGGLILARCRSLREGLIFREELKGGGPIEEEEDERRRQKNRAANHGKIWK